MKLLYTFLITVFLPLVAVGQSGTISWPVACPINDCPTAYTDPNGVQVTVTRTYGTGTGTPVNLTQVQGTTAGALGIAISSTAPAPTPGLGIRLDYGTNYTDAITGNRVAIAFDRAIGGVSFPLYDLTSPALSCTQLANTAAIYNDMVVITGTDVNGNVVSPVLVELARGTNNNGVYDAVDNPSYIVADIVSVSGNQAYVTGGYININGSNNNVTTNPGLNLVSLDIKATFSVPVTRITILYKNYDGGYFSYYKFNSVCPAALNTFNFSNGNLNDQAIMVGNINYTSILVPLSGVVRHDQNGVAGGVDGAAMPNTIVTLYDAAGTTVIATDTTDASGNYSFYAPTNASYVIGVTAPAGYQHVSSTDATPADGSTTTAVSSTAVTGINFGLNDLPPVAVNDTGSTMMNTPLSSSVAANDTCRMGPCSYSLLPSGTPGHGSVAVSADGSYIYTPDPGYTGADTFSYVLCGSGTPMQCDTAQSRISIGTDLPVDLVSLEARAETDCEVMLSWLTGIELQFDHFDVEWSTDGASFVSLASVAAKGAGSSYSYWYRHGVKGLNYFRLKMIDLDGGYRYSHIVSANPGCASQRSIKVYPTVHNGQITIEGLLAEELVSVYDLKGVLVQQVKAAALILQLDLSHTVPAGYAVVIQTQAGTRMHYKIVRQ
ncbi:Ig-like domain-containing protein [Taibaiella helva]|uniref:Ig-like domain-containing protein n=1 Tax=Taibaiella helva TaxID=2301235 RepID=UPI000E574504|nr:Ig-like domain-containing protein [Taibaiella helva]